MRIELKNLVTLCDEICLSYDRGASCKEIIDTSKVVLGCTEGINIDSLKDLNLEVLSANGEKNYLANIETCGLRLYKIVRKVYTDDKMETFELCKLRLLALRSLHLGFLTRAPNYLTALKENCSETADDNTKEQDAIQRSVIEITRGYIRTAFRGNKLEMTDLSLKHSFVSLCLRFSEDLVSPLVCIDIIRRLWGYSNITSDNYAEDFFNAALLATEFDLKILENDKKEQLEVVLKRWYNCQVILKYSQPLLQFEAVACLRNVIKSIQDKPNVNNETCTLFELIFGLYENVNKRGLLVCKKEISFESHDIVNYSKLLTSMGKQSIAEEKLTQLETLMTTHIAEHHGMDMFSFIRLKILLVRHLFELSANSLISNKAIQAFKKAVDFAVTTFTDKTDAIHAYHLLCSALFETEMFKDNIQDTIRSYFLDLDSTFSNLQETLKNTITPCITKWRLRFFDRLVSDKDFSIECSLWGIFLQLLKDNAKNMSEIDFINFISTILEYSYNCINNNEDARAKINFQFVCEQIEQHENFDYENETLVELLGRTKFSLSMLLGINLIKTAIDEKAKANLINEAIILLLDSQKLINKLNLNELTQNMLIVQLKLSLQRTFTINTGEPESEIDFDNLVTLINDVDDNNTGILSAILYEFQDHLDSEKRGLYKQFMSQLVSKSKEDKTKLTSSLTFVKVRLKLIDHLSQEDQVSLLSGKLLQKIEKCEANEIANKKMLQTLQFIDTALPILTFSCDFIAENLREISLQQQNAEIMSSDDSDTSYLLGLCWNSAIILSHFCQKFQIAFKKLSKEYNFHSTNINLMMVLILRNACLLRIIQEIISCKCDANAMEIEHTTEHLSLVSSKILLQTFKSILSFVVGTVLEASSELDVNLLPNEQEAIANALSVFHELNSFREKFCCPSCSQQDQYKEIRQITAGLKLVNILFKHHDTEEVLEKYDTLTYAKELVAQINLNSSFAYQLGVFCQLYQDQKSAKEIFNCAFQLECLKSKPDTKRCADIVISLLSLQLTSKEKIKTVSQYFQFIFKDNLSQASITDEFHKADWFASLIWNMVSQIC